MTIYKTTLKRIFINPLTCLFIFLFPIIFAILISITVAPENQKTPEGIGEYINFGLIDSDNTTLSKTLENQLSLYYNIVEVKENEIAKVLTSSQDVIFILHIKKGYSENILKGEVPVLDGYSLMVSDVSAIGSEKASSITKSLMLLGTDDKQVLSKWEENSKLKTEIITFEKEHFDLICYWFGYFGFISMFASFFIVKSLIDDKRLGMPDRLGVLPISSRSYLIKTSLAVFSTAEISVILTFIVIRFLLGSFYNPIHLFILLSLYNLFSICMINAIISFSKNLDIASMTMSIVVTLFSMIGGLFWPIEIVPDFMRKIAWFSPGYWLVEGLKNIKEITFKGYFMPLLFILAFIIVSILLGGWKKVQKLDESE